MDLSKSKRSSLVVPLSNATKKNHTPKRTRERTQDAILESNEQNKEESLDQTGDEGSTAEEMKLELDSLLRKGKAKVSVLAKGRSSCRGKVS